ncbi:MAG: Adenylate cyclase [Acidobacteriaceae bacterium]|nr:Adenylate cyclase [Acidobacteriaceae bacterium]
MFAYVSEMESWLHRAKREEEATGKEYAGGEVGVDLGSGERRRTPGRRATDSRADQPIAAIHQTFPPGPLPIQPVAWTPKLQDRRKAWSGPVRWRTGAVSAGMIVVLLVAALPFVSGQMRVKALKIFPRWGRQDSDARSLYVRGRTAWNLRTEESLKQAIDLFTQSIVHDPDYAPAYAGLADSYILLRQYGHMPDSEAFPRAIAASEQALRLDRNSAEAHRTYGMLLNSWLWNFPAAEREFRRAITLEPKDAQSHHWYATALSSEGRFEDSLREIDIAQQLEPESLVVLANRGFLMEYVDVDQAVHDLQEMEAKYPNASFVHSHLARAYLKKDDVRNFVKEERQKAILLPDMAEIALMDEVQRDSAGHPSSTVVGRLAEGYGRLTDSGGQYATRAAYFYALEKNPEKTLHYLEISSERQEDDFRSIRYEKVYRFLDSNPEFQALLKKRDTPRGSPQVNVASMPLSGPR